jgi:uncharacterized protein (TIGR02594 family)
MRKFMLAFVAFIAFSGYAEARTHHHHYGHRAFHHSRHHRHFAHYHHHRLHHHRFHHHAYARSNRFAASRFPLAGGRGAPALVREAERYLGARNFTGSRRAWCADALNVWLKRTGHSTSGSGRAIDFAHYGRRLSGPRVGAIAVMRHHVGIVVGMQGGNPVLVSGNHGRHVGVGMYSGRRIITYRSPA